MSENKLPWLRTSSTKIVNENGVSLLLRGFGLGGWLLPEGYMWKMGGDIDRPRRMERLLIESCGALFSDYFWGQYYNSFITEQDIIWIRRQGFNSIRLPFNSRTLFQFSGEDVSFNTSVLHYIDRCIHWCTEAGLYVILDMHGAPGGQTGTNIDDCENDEPELFLNPVFQQQCISMWELIAEHYADNSTIAGYDLLNEPLAPDFSHLSEHVLPLYKDITRAIRRIDQKHMIILEGTSWATNVDIFQPLLDEEYDDNWVLQFHKYWNSPDVASLQTFLSARDEHKVPLFMGEGGENNLEWYTAVFPLLESLDISWNFWTYKKMSCLNSPVSFPQPNNWPPDKTSGTQPWQDFLTSISQRTVSNSQVLRAIKREPPLNIPAAYFDYAGIKRHRSPGADFRMDSKATILFLDGHEGIPKFTSYAGEAVPDDQRMLVELTASEQLGYDVYSRETTLWNLEFDIVVMEPGAICIYVDDQLVNCPFIEHVEGMRIKETGILVPQGRHRISVLVLNGRFGVVNLKIPE